MTRIFYAAVISFAAILSPWFSAAQSGVEGVSASFERQLEAWPQEKLYVQTDKPCYIAGETVWFRAHLVNALSHMPDTTSRYVYGELINPLDSLVARVKIRPEAGAYQGRFELDPELPGGEYMLRFYTRFMESRGEDYFFRKSITVGGPLSARYRMESVAARTAEASRVDISFGLTDLQTDEPVSPDVVRVSGAVGPRDLMKTLRPVGDGTFSGSLRVGGARAIYLEYEYDGRRHCQFVPVAPLSGDYDVAFLPEGGVSPAGTSCRVAFKAIGSDGLGEDIEGFVRNTRGDTITSFRSQHRGMGFFGITMGPGEGYVAVCRNGSGAEKSYDLPASRPSAAAIQAGWRGDRLFIQVLNSTSVPAQGPFYLLVQSRGFLIYGGQWNESGSGMILERSHLPSGVIQLILTDSGFRPLSERLVFNVNRDEAVSVRFATDKPAYGRREPVSATVSLSGAGGVPLSGNFSMSVTDDRYVTPDRSVNILSTLLLTSELRGYIESPAWYFTETAPAVVPALDVLMMTQGWSRYDVASILQGNVQGPRGSLELGPVLSGSVNGGLLMNTPNPDYPVTLISLDGSVADHTATDSRGRFWFNLPELPDGVRYVVQGLNTHGGSRVEVLVDPELYPAASFSLPFTSRFGMDGLGDYLRKAEQKYEQENGARTVFLESVSVRASASAVRHSSYPRSVSSMDVLDAEKIERMGSVNNALMSLGIAVNGSDYSIRGGGSPFVQIDGVEMDAGFLSGMSILDIQEILIVKGSDAAYLGSRGDNGAILVSTKQGFDQTLRRSPQFNVKSAEPLGYQAVKEFYSPKYAAGRQHQDTTPDHRTTIYWNPSVEVTEEGSAAVGFCAADFPGAYTVIIEGVSSDGRPVYAEEKISGR